jgi:tetratricopeptide (TPR) repeat protein
VPLAAHRAELCTPHALRHPPNIAIPRASVCGTEAAESFTGSIESHRDLFGAIRQLDSEGAIESYGKALAIRQTLLARTPVDPADVEGLAELELAVSIFLVGRGEFSRAKNTFRSAAERFEGLIASQPQGPDRRNRLAVLYHRLGYAQAREGDERSAQDSMQKAIAYGEAFCSPDPQDATARARLCVDSSGDSNRRMLCALILTDT